MRNPSAIDAIAESHVDALVAHNPEHATDLGVPGHDDRLSDHGPQVVEQWAEHLRDVLGQLEAAEAVDDVDRATKAAMQDRLGLELECIEAGDHLSAVNNIDCPLTWTRDVFDLMATDTDEHWATIAARLRAVPGAFASWTETLRRGIAVGNVPARRAVLDAVGQARDLSRDTGRFQQLVGESGRDGALQDEIEKAALTAREGAAVLAEFLAEELAPVAREADGVGRERYQRASREFLGARIDLDETYEWGIESLARITAEQEEVAKQISGGTVAETIEQLNADPANVIHGTEALKAWLQATADEAIEALDGKYFTLDPRVRTVEGMIAPSATGGIYYTGPSSDFSRPGRMWWSVPEGVTEFTTWQEKTTVYHEGVPGHHLQVGQAVAQGERLNRWRSLACWVSGHGEGWALYSERLMDSFGFLSPAERLGMLDGQRLRATRVVLDLGIHLGKPALGQYGDGVWSYDSCHRLLRENVAMEENQLRFELHRYLGWPGQAPSYLIGQRIWEQIRDDAARRGGEGFDLKDFHDRALAVGSLPLDVLREVLAG
ncbi:DUF885 domain-containing protein [Arachnia propionica]|uniref:DUF885 domain-containing protein n=1 Tax=Arachnia propionica TaxID=1750 RepID=A0A3P1TC31_9ACTN|nr:DUF885 domain-containing protein [Arachnia propionica]MDO5084188.1 DUF885 domain-containing protein [Arachnia propionica]RRD06934.1 DUF885 domain-containing protein [Arachnia propionica]